MDIDTSKLNKLQHILIDLEWNYTNLTSADSKDLSLCMYKRSNCNNRCKANDKPPNLVLKCYKPLSLLFPDRVDLPSTFSFSMHIRGELYNGDWLENAIHGIEEKDIHLIRLNKIQSILEKCWDSVH